MLLNVVTFFQISALQLELEAAKDKLEATKQSSKSKNSELQSSNKGKNLSFEHPYFHGGIKI